MRIPGREIVYRRYDRSIRERRDCGELAHELSMMVLAASTFDHPVADED